MIICFTINGTEYCIDIPVLVDRRWPWDHPDPRRIDDRIDPRVSQDLTTLAVINHLSKQLSPKLQDSVSGGVKAAAEQLELPQGLAVSF
jgi:hypothetical protein